MCIQSLPLWPLERVLRLPHKRFSAIFKRLLSVHSLKVVLRREGFETSAD